jgi:uncharacterized protein (DUF2267 family)
LGNTEFVTTGSEILRQDPQLDVFIEKANQKLEREKIKLVVTIFRYLEVRIDKYELENVDSALTDEAVDLLDTADIIKLYDLKT